MGPRVRLAVAVVSTLAVGYVAVGSLIGRAAGEGGYGQLVLFNEVVRLVLDGYVEPVNLDRTMAGARMGMLDALDGDSGYLEDEEFRAFQQGPDPRDADAGLSLTRRFAFLAVASVRPESPARKAGLRPGDVIKTIDGRHTRTLASVQGERLLRGEPGSSVKLQVFRRGNEPREFVLVRERPLPLPARARQLPDGTGYLRLPEITPRTPAEARVELDGLRRAGAQQVVLDLRDMGPGSAGDGVKLAELFLKGGVVAKLAGTRLAEQLLAADASRQAWAGPLAVLVNAGTSGAGEVVAAALLDAGRASLVGQRTFGRAALQRAIPLPGGGLVLTVARYLSPKGEAIHGRGVEPSVRVDLPRAAPEDEDEEEPAAPEADRDPVLEKALEVLRGEIRKAA
jgi:carboxyl-terminal processing protease